MLAQTLASLHCPRCKGELGLAGHLAKSNAEIRSGEVRCLKCKTCYPILSGVLLLVTDVQTYLLEHVKGLAREVSDDQIPKEHRNAFAKAKRELGREHVEEDLEAERVNALYVMNHYLRAEDVSSPSPAIHELIKKHWDAGPFAQIQKHMAHTPEKKFSLVELGCGVGGLWAALRGNLKTYLGLDSSFSSIALARHFALGAPIRQKVRVPHDLLLGPVSREVTIKPASPKSLAADFIVCELDHPPVKPNRWEMTAALNVIDMLPHPESLPKLQHELLAQHGIAIQSCPYIWHQDVAAHLREVLPEHFHNSGQAVEWLYQQAGFKIEKSWPHVPWLFFKHIRQLELYSVHLFFASK